MCGRYVLKTLPSEMMQALEIPLENLPVVRYGRFNIAPSQSIVAIRCSIDSGRPELATLRWGLIPSWSKEPGAGLINARAETITEKPSFKESFQKRRCLILADGFYEWQKIGSKKQPFYFSLTTGESFAFAGIYDRWSAPSGEVIESCAIITTDANETVGKIHNRMPVIVEPHEHKIWLDRGQSIEALKALLRPLPGEKIRAQAVSPAVNSPKYDCPECLDPYEPVLNSA